MTQRNPLVKLEELGQSVWLDDLRRQMLDNGALAQLIHLDGVNGLTSNPSIFAKDFVERRAYDGAVRTLVRAGFTPEDIYEHLAVEDIRRAADLFRSVYDSSDGANGFVSLEVSPALAHDTRATVDAAQRLWQAVDRPNLMIKVPGTAAGLAAVRELLTAGINVNVTLLFGIDRYRQVAEEYLTALETRLAAGYSIANVASVASFFVSRIDTLVDHLLDSRMLASDSRAHRARKLRGEAAIASARLAYQAYQGLFSGSRWEQLVAAGARPQRLLWASTSTKDPAYRDVMYVEALAGAHTVDTLPLATLEAFRDHGRAAPRLHDGLARAQEVLDGLARLGINMGAVSERLEQEGVAKFRAAYEQILEAIDQRRSLLAAS